MAERTETDRHGQGIDESCASAEHRHFRKNIASTEDVDFNSYLVFLWSGRRSILACSLGALVISALLLFYMDRTYESEIVVISSAAEAGGGKLAGIAAQFGGLASIAGINLGADESSIQPLAILKSKNFTREFIAEHDLIKRLFYEKWDDKEEVWKIDDPEDIPTLSDAYEYFDQDIRSISQDEETGLISLKIRWVDPEEAAQWANWMIRDINELMRSRAIEESEKSLEYLKEELGKTSVVEVQNSIYRIMEVEIKNIMLANVREEYSFKVIDPALTADPDDYVSPRPFLMLTVSTFLGLALGVFVAAVRSALGR